MVKTCISDQE